MNQNLSCFLFLFAFFGLAGCSDSKVAPVSGTITFDEQPLKNAKIVFQPKKGRASSAMTNDQGYYELEYTVKEKGALIGTHKVRITTYQSTDEKVSPELLPEKYHSKTTLSKEVKPGSNTIDFKLTSN